VEQPPTDDTTVRVTTPPGTAPGASDGASTHTVLEIDTPDRPFVADSVTALLARRGLEVHVVEESVGAGRLRLRTEVDRETDATVLSALEADVLDVMADVAVTVDDWHPMRDRALASAARLRTEPPTGVAPDDVAEAAAFLEWLADDHFTFVGALDYAVTADDELEPIEGTALGVARRRPPSDPGCRGAALRAPVVLTLTKAPERSTVHRAVPFDDVRVRTFDADGEPVGERRFLGLYASSVYHDSIGRTPVLRRKAAAVLAGESGHHERALDNVLETLPRDELLRLPVDELTALAEGVVDVGERRRVQLFVAPDEYGRFVSCLVYLPRDRYTTPVREAVVDVLCRAFGARTADFSVLVGDSVMARLHVVLGAPEHQRADPAFVGTLEAELVEVARAWVDELQDELQLARGEEEGLDAWRRFAPAFPPSYQADVTAAEAVADLAVLEGLGDDDLALRLVRGDDDGTARLVLYRSGAPIVLSDVMPVLEQLDVVVVDERPYEVRVGADDTATRWIYSFGVHTVSGAPLDDPDLQARVAEMFLGVWRGAIENDGLNRLVVAAGLVPRDVVVLRALVKYLRQTGLLFTDATIEAALTHNPAATRGVLELFHARLDPGATADATAVDDALGRAIDAVASLDDDRILRALASVTRAVVRTNASFAPEVVDDRLAVKLDPRLLEFLPRPRPVHEIWVYSPRVEGVHLRGGDVARGGIRWSDRRDDFRTEVLGLMKAQTAKNAVIVPVGAKGGFVVKRALGLAPEALSEEVQACYRSFVRGMLDLTDDLVEGVVVPPPLVRHDGDDPYLVVAADKGTATFSDVANELAAEYGYWLGDAFASGGATGYDHKAMGITSRGAWISVRTHFRQLGVDADTAELTVVGIGDMSGDVFGNGMLRSPHLRLVAAFDHRHVFCDPDPDPVVSFRERQRLFALERSSWADYDPALLSEGGGVYQRDAKAVELSPQARAVLGLGDAGALTPAEVISAILCAPVDLVWNGGIGTFVKASHETHEVVGDRANDAVRVDASAVRCRVVAEGGNLGLTQAARVEYALAGGHVYTDAIDNSAGVDCSDHEVNIKILLREAITGGELPAQERDPLLRALTDEVAALVLADNEAQANALELAAFESTLLLSVHARQIERLERAGILDRRLEGLPDAKQVQERSAAGKGLTAPELAVLLAFTKLELQRQLVASDVPDDPALEQALLDYFPAPLRDRFRDAARRHRLRRDIVATVIANAVVNRAGISFLSRMVDELGCSLATLARAHLVARDVYRSADVWAAVDALDLVVAPEVQSRLFLSERRLVERAARWLTRRDDTLAIGPTVERYREGVAAIQAQLPELLGEDARVALREAAHALEADGVPAELALRTAGAEASLGALTAVDLASARGVPVEHVAAVHYELESRLGLDWLRERIAALPRADRWQTEARAALRDDLTDGHRALTESVLETTPGTGEDAPAAVPMVVSAWLDRERDAVERYERIVDEVRAGNVFDLAQLTAARRALRDLSDPDA
jgi:glutamate dehydrogenase